MEYQRANHDGGPSAIDAGLSLERMHALGSIAGSLAHELSNPLATIIATAQGLLSFWPSRDAVTDACGINTAGNAPTAVRQQLQTILDDARYASRVVGDLLDFAGGHPERNRPVPVTTLVSRIVRFTKHHLRLNGIGIDYSDVNRIGESLAAPSPSMLAHALISLVLDAQRTMLDDARGGHIAIHTVGEGDGASISVMFRPSDKPRTTPGARGDWVPEPGVLDMAVASFGGSIERDDETHRVMLHLGNLARISPLPEPSAVPGTVAPPDNAPKAQGPASRVLLVDDEEGVRKSLGRFLSRSGFNVDTAVGGADALKKIREQSYDVVVSDLRMPGFSGEELYRRVCHEIPAMANRIIFSSGDMMREETTAFLQSTGCPALEKPYELTDLVEAIRSIGSAHGARKTSRP